MVAAALPPRPRAALQEGREARREGECDRPLRFRRGLREQREREGAVGGAVRGGAHAPERGGEAGMAREAGGRRVQQRRIFPLPRQRASCAEKRRQVFGSGERKCNGRGVREGSRRAWDGIRAHEPATVPSLRV